MDDKANSSEEISDDNDNFKNHELEQRSSVSEIVSKLNNLSSFKTGCDWEKLKRRPVLSSNEVEKELQKPDLTKEMSEETCDDRTNGNESSPCKISAAAAGDQDHLNNNNDTASNRKERTEDGGRRDEECEKKLSLQLPTKKLKGSLKRKEKKTPRRVSFDPLALLLDASLEGELELVKKSSLEVWQ